MSAAVIRMPFRADQKVIALLRQQIQAIECNATAEATVSPGWQNSERVNQQTTVPLGTPEIDTALPWNGFPISGLHEICGDAAALGFSAVLLSRLAEFRSKSCCAPILWCQQEWNLCGQGLTEFGIEPDQLILVHGKSNTDILWAMEEGLRVSGLTAVIGKLHKIPSIAGRRLHLAAKKSGTTGLLIRATSSSIMTQTPTSSALTRWQVTSAPSITPAHGEGLGAPQWHLELQRCRLSATDGKKLENAGHPKSWQVEWCNETSDLTVVTNLCDRPALPQTLWKTAG